MKRKRIDELDATGAAGAAPTNAEKEQELATPQLPTDQIANAALPVKKGFFDLPREIRDMIYHCIWSDTTSIRQHHAGNVYTVTYGVKPKMFTWDMDCRGESAAWLLANKQTLQEGLGQLSQEITWHFGPTIRQSQRKSRRSRLILPSKARGYQLQIGWDEQGLEMEFQRGRYALEEYPYTPAGMIPDTRIPNILDTDTRIPNMLDFTKRTSIVTTLHVDINRGDIEDDLIDHMRKHGQVDFDLWQLEQFRVCTRLRKFSVMLHSVIFKHSGHVNWRRGLFNNMSDEKRYLENFRKELSRIGRILVGNGKESAMSFDTYVAQSAKLEMGLNVTWDYRIEK